MDTQLVDSLAVGVYTVDRSGVCLQVNPAALSLLGYRRDDLLGHDIRSILDTNDGAQAPLFSATGMAIRDVEVDLRAASGESLHVVASSFPLAQNDGCSVITLQHGSLHHAAHETRRRVEREQAEILRQRDAAARIEQELAQETANRQRRLAESTQRAAAEQLRTQQKAAEERLLQSEKLAAVGRLAASISHEINNPLEAVTNLLYLVKTDASLSSEAGAYLEQAEKELGRVSQIVSQTLRFQRGGTQLVPVEPKALVESVLSLHQGRLHHKRIRIRVTHRRARTCSLAEGDVRQILNNLVGNAIDAMSSDGGTLTLRTAYVRHARTGEAGLRVVVSDTGTGMDSRTTERMFEPFYTTKGSSGSGLGLWISGTLAQRHGGRLTVRSCTGGRRRGTTFSLFLPERSPEADENASKSKAA